MMRAHLWILCCLILSVPPMGRAAENATLRAALLSITAEELKSHVDVLADDAFEGREAGSRGGRAAGGYLVTHFEQRGVRGTGPDGSVVQAFRGGYRNVLGFLPGRDPTLRDEVIVIGAHYDHVGYGNRANSFGPFGYVHNGADDNASGVAGLLEVLDAFTMLPELPRRSLLFALWDGEEKGLLGSNHWVENPTVPLSQVVFAINIDMIGRLRNRQLEVFGTRSGHGLRRLLSEANRELQFRLDFSWEMKSNSDHYPFFASSIPVLMFHTGLHDDYHRPSDDTHLINLEGMQEVSRFLFNAIYELAERDAITGFRTAGELDTPAVKQQLEAPLGPPTPRLGVRWQEPNDDVAGLRLIDVSPDSAAQRAGLQVGDRLLRFAGKEPRDSDTFRSLVLESGSPVQAVIARDGQPEPLELSIRLDGKPTRIGISWREDEGEPGTAIVTRVIPGSPARGAGLRTRDRIYEVAGRRFQNTRELFHLLTTLPGPIELVIERNGQLRTVELAVPAASS